MASARITQRWPDGIELEVEIYVDENYPDAVAEARAQVEHLWATASEASE